jgi:hypothetical protein
MSQFSDLVSAAADITKRPDLTSLHQNAVRMATLRAHHVELFNRDLSVVTVNYTIDNSAQFVDIPNIYDVVPEWRIAQFGQGMDSGRPVENLEWREYSDFWDKDNIIRSSVFTLIGETLRMSLAVQTGVVNMHVYQNPVIATDATFKSWIATKHPDDIAWWAAAIVWARTGYMEQAKNAQDNYITPFKEILSNAYAFAGQV